MYKPVAADLISSFTDDCCVTAQDYCGGSWQGIINQVTSSNKLEQQQNKTVSAET
jgi:hypothetical protein